MDIVLRFIYFQDLLLDAMRKANRRKILGNVGKASIIGITAVSGVGKVAADTGDQSNNLDIDTNFNPNNIEEVTEFMEDLGDLSEEDRIEAQEALNEPRSEAVIDWLEGIEFKHETQEPEEVRTTSTGWDSISVTGTESAEHWTGTHTVLEFEYTVEWEYNSWENEIRNISEQPHGTTPDPSWSHDGVVNNWINEDDDEFNAYRQHQFSYVGGGSIPSLTLEPYIEITGDHNGFGRVVDSGGT
ncbi:hypothetical protein [Halostagnicola bangensis]